MTKRDLIEYLMMVSSDDCPVVISLGDIEVEPICIVLNSPDKVIFKLGRQVGFSECEVV